MKGCEQENDWRKGEVSKCISEQAMRGVMEEEGECIVCQFACLY